MGTIAVHPRSDRCVQWVACEEDRAFSRDLLKRAGAAKLLEVAAVPAAEQVKAVEHIRERLAKRRAPPIRQRQPLPDQGPQEIKPTGS